MKVRIPTPLYSYTESRANLEAEGTTIDEVVRHLDRQYPGIRFRMIDEQDHIRPHIKFFVNGEQVFNLKESLRPSDEIDIIQAFSGG